MKKKCYLEMEQQTKFVHAKQLYITNISSTRKETFTIFIVLQLKMVTNIYSISSTSFGKSY